jgi:hypothetical protein
MDALMLFSTRMNKPRECCDENRNTSRYLRVQLAPWQDDTCAGTFFAAYVSTNVLYSDFEGGPVRRFRTRRDASRVIPWRRNPMRVAEQTS